MKSKALWDGSTPSLIIPSLEGLSPPIFFIMSRLFDALEKRFNDLDECRDIAEHGCEMGVSGFIYYHETRKFFLEHEDEIEAYLDGIYGDSIIEALSKDNPSINQLMNAMVWIVVRDHCCCVVGKAEEEAALITEDLLSTAAQ